jgi:hypothetical protein
MIKQFLKNKQNQKIGVLIAYAHENQVKIGYSACSPADVYDKYLGEVIATGRAEKGIYYIPYRYYDTAVEFIERCNRYFKNEKMPEWTTEYV